MRSASGAPGEAPHAGGASADTLEIRFAFGFRVEKPPGDASVGAILCGPSMLVATSSRTSSLPAPTQESALGMAFTPIAFTAGDLMFETFSKATHTAYLTHMKF